MPLTDLGLLLKHCPEMATVPTCHPDNATEDARLRLWWLVRYSHTQEHIENFGGIAVIEAAEPLVVEVVA